MVWEDEQEGNIGCEWTAEGLGLLKVRLRVTARDDILVHDLVMVDCAGKTREGKWCGQSSETR